MAQDDDELGDAASRAATRQHRATFERGKSKNGEYAYVPRWVPSGNWRMSRGDLVVIAFGLAIIALILGMRLWGVIAGR